MKRKKDVEHALIGVTKSNFSNGSLPLRGSRRGLFRADLHIHTLLSPCGSLEMNPARIISEAKKRGLDIIGITDHNTTRQCREVVRIGDEVGVKVFCGVEITTQEEAHCLAFFENFEKLDAFQVYLDAHLSNIKNVPDKFGDQVWVDENEMIAGEETRLLISALDQSVGDIEKEVHKLNGLFIAAHIDRPSYSLISQLEFIPVDLKLDGVELTDISRREMIIKTYSLPKNLAVITSSDAHHPEQIGTKPIELLMEEATFEELRKSLRNQPHPDPPLKGGSDIQII